MTAPPMAVLTVPLPATPAKELEMKKSATGGVRHRSAKSGQFVTEQKATQRPSTTLSERINGGSTNGSHRSAKTGEFVTESYAKKHPSSTIKDN
jgi:hypothetical protein